MEIRPKKIFLQKYLPWLCLIVFAGLVFILPNFLSAAETQAELSPPSPSCQADGPHMSLNWIPASGNVLDYEIYRDGVKIGQTSGTSFDDNQNTTPGLEGTKIYNSPGYVVRTRWQDGSSMDSALFQATAPACAPTLQPVNSICYDGVAPGGQKADLSWNNLLGVSEYQIYRKAQSEPIPTLLATTNQTSYTDNFVQSLPLTYHLPGSVLYYVKAVWQTEQRDSQMQSISIQSCKPYLTIQTNCTAGQESVLLYWTATMGATNYNTYFNGIPGPQFDQSLAGLPWQEYVGIGIPNSFYVKAAGPVIGEIESNHIDNYSISCTALPPSPPPHLNQASTYCSNGIAAVKFSWSSSQNVSSYSIYRNITTFVATTLGTIYDSDETGGIQSGYSYEYTVEAVGPGGSVYADNTQTIIAPDCTPPNASTLTIAPPVCESGLPVVNLSWTQTNNTEAYELWRGPSESNLSLLITFDKNSQEYNSRIWKDTNVSKSTTYYYKIRSIGPPGVAYTDSNVLPPVTTNSCDLATPSLNTLTQNCLVDGNPAVNLAWELVDTNVYYYEIFRNGASVKAISRGQSGFDTRTWQNTGLSPNTLYTYRVDAVGYGASPVRKSSASQQITTNICTPPGAFNLNSPTVSCNSTPWPSASLTWSASSNANSYDMIRTQVSNGSTETALTVNSPYYDRGFHNALSFNGTNGFLSTSWSPTLGISGSATFEAWIKIADTNWPSDMAIFAKKVSLTDNSGFQLSYNPAANSLRLYTSGTNFGEAIIDLDTSWHHIVATVSGTTAKFYVDGTDITTDGSTGALSTSGADFNIGRNGYLGSHYFYGAMDELRIYNRAISPAEVTEHYSAIYNNETFLKALWHFDEGSGSTVSDSSNSNYLGHAEDATRSTGTSWTTDGPQANTTYTWQARALGPGGSTLSNSTNQSTIPTCQPTKPGLTLKTLCSGGLSSVVLKWSYTTATTRFEIYRQDYLGGTTALKIINSGDAEFNSRTWTDNNQNNGLTPGTNYTYWIKAFGPGGQSQSDQIVSGLTQNCAAPPAPAGLNAQFACAGTGNSFPQITVSWSATAGATSYSLIRIPGWPYGVPFYTTAATTYIDTNVTTTYSYSYSVSATGPGGSGPYSPSTPNVYVNYCQPSTPSIISINTSCNGSIPQNSIAWSDATPFNTLRYEIYRNTTNSIPGSPTKIISTSTTPTEFTSRTWNDNSGLSSLTNYFYWVKTIGPIGTQTSASSQKQTNNCAAAPIAPTLSLAPNSPFCENNLPYTTFTWNNVANAISYTLYRTNPAPPATYSTRLSPFTDRGAFSLNFDGADDVVTIPDSVSLSPTSAMSFSVWVYQDSLVSDKAIASKWHTSQETWLIRIRTTGAQGQIWVNTATSLTDLYTTKGVTPLGSWTAGQWHHLVFTYNGAGSTNAERLKIYIDGAQKTLTFTGTIPASLTNSTANLKIGQEINGQNFNGKIDDARMYNRTLSSAEVTQQFNNNYRNESGLVGAWHFDEGSGTTAFDESGNLNNGSLLNGAYYLANSPSALSALPLQRSSAYTFSLKAFGADTESPASTPVSFTAPSCLPAVPVLTADAGCNVSTPKITLSWGQDLENNTDYWIITRTRLDDGSINLLYPSDGAISYEDTDIESGVDYDYYVTAYGYDASLYEFSNVETEKADFGLCGDAPPPPVISGPPTPVCFGQSSRIKIIWDEDLSGKTLTYNIWRKNVTLGEQEPDFSLVPTGSGILSSITEFVDSYNIVELKDYIYKIEAVGSNGTSFSEPSETVTSIICENIPPFPPDLWNDPLSSFTADDLIYVTLVWNDAGPEWSDIVSAVDPEKQGYRLFRREVGTTNWFDVFDFSRSDDEVDDFYYPDWSIEDGKTYDYRVFAYNDYAPFNASYDPTNPTTSGGRYSYIWQVYIPPARPGNFILSGARQAQTIDLTWTAAATTNAGGPVTYTVVRGNSDFSQYSYINNCQDISILNCTDDSPSFSESYYKVIAKNNGGTTDSNTINMALPALNWKELIPWF